MEVLKQQYSGHSSRTQVYECSTYSGLVSPIHSNSNSEAEDESSHVAERSAPGSALGLSMQQRRAVKFQQCPRPCRLEPAPKKLRCPTPPVTHVLTDDEDDEDDEEDDDNAEESLDTIHADRFRRCSLSSEDESDDDSQVFHLE